MQEFAVLGEQTLEQRLVAACFAALVQQTVALARSAGSLGGAGPWGPAWAP